VATEVGQQPQREHDDGSRGRILLTKGDDAEGGGGRKGEREGGRTGGVSMTMRAEVGFFSQREMMLREGGEEGGREDRRGEHGNGSRGRILLTEG